MIASIYINDGDIHFYNEQNSFSDIGGIAYELGRPLLDFICYEPERFEDGFSIIAEAFDNEYAHMGSRELEFIAKLKEMMTELQQKEIYVFFYVKELIDSVYSGEPLQNTVKRLSEHLYEFQGFIINEIEVLLHYRNEFKVPADRSIDYIDILDEYHSAKGYGNYYLENPFNTFYGRTSTREVEQLYAINSIEDLFRFEFIKMIENDIFIKKCKNCECFFIPRRRADAEYCERIYVDTNRKCSEVGATLRYEKKISENPILEAHKKAYRRLHSRTRAKKMTQSEFLKWSEEASQKRDECLVGELPFDEFVAWLEQGRVRKSRDKTAEEKTCHNFHSKFL